MNHRGMVTAGADHIKRSLIAPPKMRGVTLIELMVTLAIAATLGGLGVSGLSSMSETEQERGELLRVKEHLEEARSLARSLLSPVEVSIDAHTLYIAPVDGELRSYTLPQTLLGFNTESGTLTFNARGGTDEPTPTVLTLRSARNTLYQYAIYPAIGTVRLL